MGYSISALPGETFLVTTLDTESLIVGEDLLRQLEARGILAGTADGSHKLAVPIARIRPATGFCDRLDGSDDVWSAVGWAADPISKQPFEYVFALQAGKIVPVLSLEKVVRCDVNEIRQLPGGTRSGFILRFKPTAKQGQVNLLAVLPSGRVAHVGGLGAVSIPEQTVVSPALSREEWQSKCRRPLQVFASDSSFHDIYFFGEHYDPALLPGVTSQFLEEAGVYHRKYTDYSRWRHLLSHAFLHAQVDDTQPLAVLDVGSGAGNTIVPLLQMLPLSDIVATDISPQLLAILRDGLNEAERKRTLLVAMDAGEANFQPETFDLVCGAAILHHIIDPSHTISACAQTLRTGGHAIFFEPFEAGYGLLRILYEQLLEHRGELGISDSVAQVLRAIIRDVEVRTGTDKSAEIYQQIDDKWGFTRTYFEEQQEKHGYSGLEIYSLDSSHNKFSAQIRTHLRLCLGAGDEALTAAAWEYVRAFEGKFSVELASEILMEACVILTK